LADIRHWATGAVFDLLPSVLLQPLANSFDDVDAGAIGVFVVL
jgi:hypothetical protein